MSASTVAALSRNVPQQRGRDLIRLMDVLKDDAAMELGAALTGVSIRRIVAAEVSGASAYGISRGVNGADSNPLYRIAAIFILLKRMGMGRAKAQRIVDWLQSLVDLIWPEEDEQKKETEGGRA